MIKMFVIIFTTLVFSISISNAQQYTLTPTYVGQNKVEATFNIYNNTSQDIDWSSPDTGWCELAVDNQINGNIPGMMVLSFQLQPGESISDEMAFISNSLSLGHHSVQAWLHTYTDDGTNWLPVGETLDILVHQRYEFVSVNFNVETMNSYYLTANFSMTNNDLYELRNLYFGSGMFSLNFDGVSIPMSAVESPGYLDLAPNDTFSTLLICNPIEPISYGQHTLILHFGDYGDLPPLTYTFVDPSGNEDQTNIPLVSKIYPNPFRDELHIEYTKTSPGLVSLEVYNIKGQLVYHNSVLAKSGTNEIKWNGNNLNHMPCPSGIYIICLKNGKKIQHLKCLKVE